MVVISDSSCVKVVVNIFKFYVYSFDELFLVERFVVVFKFFMKVINCVCGDKLCIFYKIIFLLMKLVKCVEIDFEDLILIKKIKEKMKLEF